MSVAEFKKALEQDKGIQDLLETNNPDAKALAACHLRVHHTLCKMSLVTVLPQVMRELFDTMDDDGDGQIQRDEFLDFFE